MTRTPPDTAPDTPPDTLTQAIGVLTRREVEARILAPLVDALCREFDRDRVLDILRETIVGLARDQGAQLARQFGRDGRGFRRSLEAWTRGGALEIEVLAEDDTRLDFDVRRCRYAEMYHALGIPELGRILSCNRDFALIEGFAPGARLTREQTILEGAPCCTFRYRFPATDKKPD